MAARGVAKRYAKAVFDLAQESNTLDQWMADLQTLANAAADPVLGAYLTDPSVEDSRKQAALEQFVSGAQQQLARNLALMLIERRRVDILPELLNVYRDMVLEARGIAIANVTTAVELSTAEQDEVKNRLAQIVGRQIELRAHVDPSLIGGLVARVGDRLIDGSVATQLRNMRASLAR